MSKIAGEINAEMMKTTGATQALTDRMVQEIESLRQQLADMTAERDEFMEYAKDGTVVAAQLQTQLATFHSAVEHVTEDGCTRRSFVAMPEGWAMVHKDRLHALELAE